VGFPAAMPDRPMGRLGVSLSFFSPIRFWRPTGFQLRISRKGSLPEWAEIPAGTRGAQRVEPGRATDSPEGVYVFTCGGSGRKPVSAGVWERPERTNPVAGFLLDN
jgi:hypothetical protein